MDKPCLSVVVASYNSKRTIRACLNSLRQQSFSGAFETIVVDSSNDGTGELVATEFPEVNLVCFSTRKFPGDARNVGIANARGDIICFLDSDCRADPEWLSQIWRTHSRPEPAIGGCVGNAATHSSVGWASYFTEFTSWMPGTPRGSLADIPTCNLTFKRWVLNEMGPFGENRYCEDTAFNWRLQKAGYPRPFFEPSIAVAHDGIIHLRTFLAHEVFHGRSYGRLRVRLDRLGLLRRLSYVIAVPLIHLTLCARVTSRVFRSGRFTREFVRSAPLVFLGLLAWSFGEGMGYAQQKD